MAHARKIPLAVQLSAHRRMDCLHGLVIAVWTAAVLMGMYYLMVHSNICGPRGENPRRWPVESKLPHATKQPTLLVFMHPLCPCSVSTLSELQRIIANCRGRMKTVIIFTAESDSLLNQSSNLVITARNEPNADVVFDVRGQEAARFGAATSGHAFLFSPSGRLCFDGGITAARAHAGDNLGRLAVEDWLLTGRSQTQTTPVFGCGLFNPSSNTREGTK